MPTRRRLAIYLFFALTGAFGLTYEVVWSRYLALLVGNSATAHTAVLATFMGGLALGAWLFGDLADRVSNGLKTYALLELIIGAYAVLFDPLFEWAHAALLSAATHLEPGSLSLTSLKFGLAVACILPPTVLMGGTLPLLTRYLTGTPEGLRQSVARLYAVNSLGAVAGGLAAGFYFIEALGLPPTMILVGGANVVMALGVWVLSARWPAAQAHDVPPVIAGSPDATQYGRRARRLAFWLAGFSGLATMSLEVAWIRYFSLVLGSSTYAFTLMLAAFISGIALGAWWLSTRRAGRIPLAPILVVALLLTASFLAVSVAGYDTLPWYLAKLQRVFRPHPDAFATYQFAMFGVCFLLMLPATVAAGLVFPATIRLATESGRMGGRLGRVYAINTLGTLLGATATSLLLFEWVGLENIFRGLVIAYALAAMATAWALTEGTTRRRWVLAGLAVLAGHLVLHPGLDPLTINLGLYRQHRDLGPNPEAYFAPFRTEKMLLVAQGAHAMVTVRENGRSRTLADAPLRVLTVNGKEDASTGADMPTQVLLAHIPMSLHPAPKHTFVVGLGSGATAGSALSYGGQVDVAEISPEVVAGAALFSPWNGAPIGNPRCRLFVDDAKTALQFAGHQYDVVISEPTNPWLAGIAGLFSAEFYGIVDAHLAPNGLFAQWMHSYETDDATVAMVITTLRAVFPYVYVFEPSNADYLFVASRAPIPFDAPAFRARVRQPEVARDLARVHLLDPAVLLATQVQSAALLPLDLPASPITRDRHPLLEFQAPVKFFANLTSTLLDTTDARRGSGPTLFWSRYVQRYPVGAPQAAALAQFFALEHQPVARRAALMRLARTHLGPRHPVTRSLTGQVITEAPGLVAWRSGAIDLTDPVRAVEQIQLGLQLAARWNWLWAPFDLQPLADALDALDAQGLPVNALRARLAALTCTGSHTLCQRLTDQLTTVLAAATQPPPWRARYAEARVAQALGAGHLEMAREWLKRWARTDGETPPVLKQMHRIQRAFALKSP
jgi:spermidine synthase